MVTMSQEQIEKSKPIFIGQFYVMDKPSIDDSYKDCIGVVVGLLWDHVNECICVIVELADGIRGNWSLDKFVEEFSLEDVPDESSELARHEFFSWKDKLKAAMSNKSLIPEYFLSYRSKKKDEVSK